jgi:hypothetical protein
MYVKYGIKVVGKIMTDRSMTIGEALDLIGIDPNETDGGDPVWDYGLFEMDYGEDPGTISLDNGLSVATPEEAIKEMDWETIVNSMDDEVREEVHMDKAPCSNLEFLTAYLSTGNSIIIG